MPAPRLGSSIVLLLALTGLVGCGEKAVEGKAGAQAAGAGGAGAPAAPGGIAQAATLEGLAAQFQALRKAGDVAGARALGASMVPSTIDLVGLLRPGRVTDDFLSTYPLHDMKTDDPRVDDLAKALFLPGEPTDTEVKVHASTTEELAAYAEGTAAFAEFPRGGQRFAQLVAAPGRTWYVVELVAPGQSAGMKFSVFTKLGDRHLFLAKPWRALPETK